MTFSATLRTFVTSLAMLGMAGSLCAAEEIRIVPPRPLPAPVGVSAELKGLIEGPMNPSWNQRPASPEAWRALVKTYADAIQPEITALAAQTGVTIRQDQMGGVPVFWLEPAKIPDRNRRRVLLNFHGGAYVFAPGRAGLRDAILLAAHGYRVVSVDYRMAPDAPYPAAIDDAEAVWRVLSRTYKPRRIGVFGSSTGGGMTLVLGLRAKAKSLPLPGAMWAGTPWSDLTKTGDSYFINDQVDNALVSYDGLLGAAAKIYAGGADMRLPELSPVYGDMSHFPPVLLTTGTRDLFLSNTIRVHRRLRQVGAITDLAVYEGLSHGDFERRPDLPESREVYMEAARFFDKNLSR